MSRGKYLSLEEARKMGKLARFAEEHPIEDAHPQARQRFKGVLDAMARGTLEGEGTFDRAASEGYSDTRTPPDTSEDASG